MRFIKEHYMLMKVGEGGRTPKQFNSRYINTKNIDLKPIVPMRGSYMYVGVIEMDPSDNFVSRGEGGGVISGRRGVFHLPCS